MPYESKILIQDLKTEKNHFKGAQEFLMDRKVGTLVDTGNVVKKILDDVQVHENFSMQQKFQKELDRLDYWSSVKPRNAHGIRSVRKQIKQGEYASLIDVSRSKVSDGSPKNLRTSTWSVSG